jgi:hypothetical protein
LHKVTPAVARPRGTWCASASASVPAAAMRSFYTHETSSIGAGLHLTRPPQCATPAPAPRTLARHKDSQDCQSQRKARHRAQAGRTSRRRGHGHGALGCGRATTHTCIHLQRKTHGAKAGTQRRETRRRVAARLATPRRGQNLEALGCAQ